MKKHVMSLTYEPKLDAVFNDICHQTIRHKSVEVGDEILFHEWTGKPYRSKWGRRIKVKVTKVDSIIVIGDSIGFIQKKGTFLDKYNINHWKCDRLAELDHISPPTGDELIKVLFKLNPSVQSDLPMTFYVITWEVMKS